MSCCARCSSAPIGDAAVRVAPDGAPVKLAGSHRFRIFRDDHGTRDTRRSPDVQERSRSCAPSRSGTAGRRPRTVQPSRAASDTAPGTEKLSSTLEQKFTRARLLSLTRGPLLSIVSRMTDSTNSGPSPHRRAGTPRRDAAPSSDAVIQAGRLWRQHCSWCARCDVTRPGCQLGRSAYELYVWLARMPIERAG
jgi:hypothetical protein